MSRNIVLLSDGTGNSAAKVWRTNVWRTFEALDLSGNDQVAFYDDGQDLPDVERLAIVSMTTASVDRDGSSIDADVWVLEVFPRKANA